MGSPRKVFAVVFVTLHTSPVSVHLHLISSHLDFLSRDAALWHQRVIRHKKTSTVSSGSLSWRVPSNSITQNGKVVLHCAMLIVTFQHVAFFLSKPIRVFPARGLPLNGCGKSPGSNHNETLLPLERQSSIHPPSLPTFSCTSGQGDLLESITAVIGQRHPGQVAASSRSRRDNMMYWFNLFSRWKLDNWLN